MRKAAYSFWFSKLIWLCWLSDNNLKDWTIVCKVCWKAWPSWLSWCSYEPWNRTGTHRWYYYKGNRCLRILYFTHFWLYMWPPWHRTPHSYALFRLHTWSTSFKAWTWGHTYNRSFSTNRCCCSFYNKTVKKQFRWVIFL